MAMLAYLTAKRVQEPKMSQTIEARIARVHRVLARHVRAAKTATVDVIVTIPDTHGVEGERHYSVAVDASGSYEQFIDDLLEKLVDATGGHEVGLDDLQESGETPLRLYLEAVKPPNHEATKLFYDWVEGQYRWNSWSDIAALSKDGSGFANTPFTWDYYADDAALLNDYYDAFIDELFNEDENGDRVEIPDSAAASRIWSHLEYTSGVLDVKEDQLVTGDRFLVRWA